MTIHTLERLTTETERRYPEGLNSEHVAYMGRLAIQSEFLGINDPLTHLYQYLKKGETALTGIREDIETDIAERLPKTPFVNYVGFEFTGDDFVSIKDKVSMGTMTKTNLQKFEAEVVDKPYLADELARAETEAQEVTKLTTWFKQAPVGGYLIFESLPIAEQKIAISRLYQKTSDERLEGCFVSLYSSSVEQFNQLRQKLDVDSPNCKTKQEILQNCYEFYTPKLTLPNKFVDCYVDAYDELLQRSNKQYGFGLEKDEKAVKQNGILKARSQPKLTSIYLDTIKTLASSEGIVTADLIGITDKLSIDHQLTKNQTISKEMARDIMSEVILRIVSVIDKADDGLLSDLAGPSTGQEASYAAMSYFGEQAKASGETYASGGCPEYSFSNTATTTADLNSEYAVIQRAFGITNTPNNFGIPKIGVCRISNCPSRGELSWWSDKTLVGGCDFCVGCHKFLEKGKSPQKIYDKQNEKKRKTEQTLKKAAKKQFKNNQSKNKSHEK